jgi:hypothetical protein
MVVHLFEQVQVRMTCQKAEELLQEQSHPLTVLLEFGWLLQNQMTVGVQPTEQVSNQRMVAVHLAEQAWIQTMCLKLAEEQNRSLLMMFDRLLRK